MTVIIDRTLNGGTQVVHRFENNFGASVVRHKSSYGSEEGLFELAVLTFADETNDYELTYDTEITNDVLGYLTEEDVESLLKRIERLGTDVEEEIPETTPNYAAAFNMWMSDYMNNPQAYEDSHDSAVRHLKEKLNGEEPSYGAVCQEVLIKYLEKA